MTNSSEPVHQSWQGQGASEMATTAASIVQALYDNEDAARKTAAVTATLSAAFAYAQASAASPAEVAANHDELEQLIATDVLGLNTAAIATNRANHQQMEARSQQAMVTYHDQATMAAAQLTPVPQAPTGALPLNPHPVANILQPLETITEQLFAGPGPNSMFAAANAWGGLAQDAAVVAQRYEATVQQLVATQETQYVGNPQVPTQRVPVMPEQPPARPKPQRRLYVLNEELDDKSDAVLVGVAV